LHNLAKYRWKLCAASAAFACLSGCISAIKYGDVPHGILAADARCNPAGGSVADITDITDKPFYAVTTRLPDCRSESLLLTDFRSEQMRFIRFAGPINRPAKKGKANMVTPIAFETQAAWWAGLSADAARNNGRVLLYVHGYRETFASTSRDSAHIARLTGFKGPVIQYSWPSQGELLSYGVDETNMYWTERNFRSFLQKLAQQPWVKDIVLVSHSLGARLVIPSVEYVDSKAASADASNISNIILASPDVDTADFERDIAAEILSQRRVDAGRRMTIYAAANDKALGISRTLHGYPRLGSPFCFNPFEAAALKAKGLPERCYAANLKLDGTRKKAGLTIIDTTAVSIGSGHSNHLRSRAACADFAAVVNNKANDGRTATHLSHVFTLAGYPKKAKIDHDTACMRTP
jgi:esterase/lipase superfamily enzyme